MTSDEVAARWVLAVRVLAIASALLLVAAVLEGRAIRRARRDLQQLRSERDKVQAGVASTWTRQPPDEVGRTIRWLDDFYREPAEGFGRRGGLCASGRLDDTALVTNVMGVFLPARASGKSWDASLGVMKDAILRSDQYRAVHPDLALPPRDAGGR
jgi:hypothetical protein